MRHRKKFNHLGRKSQHRQAMLSNMAASLILKKRITTTLAKAKALRVYVEPLITKSKEDSTHSRRTVFSYLQNKNAVSELFREVAQKIAERPGGYTRILKTGFRKGDGAEMCFIELVDYNPNMLKTSEDTQKKSTRRSRRGKKSSDDGSKPVEAKADEIVEPEVAEEKTEDEVTQEPQAQKPEEPQMEKPEEIKEETKEEKGDTVKDEKKEEPKAKKDDEASSDEKKGKKEE